MWDEPDGGEAGGESNRDGIDWRAKSRCWRNVGQSELGCELTSGADMKHTYE